MLTDPGLRDELDRVAAAVGVRVVHLGGRHLVSRKTWSAAAAVVLDHAAADRCGRLALPRRTHVSVLTGTEAATATWAAAITVGAQHVLRMPEQEGELVRELAEAAESARDDGICGAVVAVIGGRGGAGASLFAVALAQAAADALLVDLDPWAAASIFWWAAKPPPGLRWPDLALQGGRLNWSAVRAALPRPRGDQRALGNSARLRVRRRAGGRRDRRRPTWGSHRGLRSSTSSDRCHPSSAGCRRSRRPGQPMRCAGMCGRRDDGACADRDQPQPGSGGAGALPGGIAGGRGRGRRRGAATGIHEGPAAASRTAGTRGSSTATAIGAGIGCPTGTWCAATCWVRATR